MKLSQLFEGKIKDYLINNPGATELPKVSSPKPETRNSIETQLRNLAALSGRSFEFVEELYVQLRNARNPQQSIHYAALMNDLKRQLGIS